MPYVKHILFKHFHLGGCASCGYGPEETIAEVAQKHQKDGDAIVETVNNALARTRDSFINVREFSDLMKSGEKCFMIDVREPWEADICKLEGSVLLSQSNIEDLFKEASTYEHVIVICHHGLRAFNATVYMHANNLPQARCLKGGLDAYSVEIDSSLARY